MTAPRLQALLPSADALGAALGDAQRDFAQFVDTSAAVLRWRSLSGSLVPMACRSSSKFARGDIRDCWIKVAP